MVLLFQLTRTLVLMEQYEWEQLSRTKEDPALSGTEENPRNIPGARRHLQGSV